MKIVMVLFPNFTQLDLTAPYEVFSKIPHAELTLASTTRKPVKSDTGLRIVPDKRLQEVAGCDLLCIPGGPGINEAILNKKLIRFVREQAKNARYVTSVCTGSLVLGAAGLLQGYRATTHWQSMKFLSEFGAHPVSAPDVRFVIDRNRITGGGITSGLDFALGVVSELFGKEEAQKIQLALEYNPKPPFPMAGHPVTADPDIVQTVIQESQEFLERRAIAVQQAAKNLRTEVSMQ